MFVSVAIDFLTECIKNSVLFLTAYYFLSNKMIVADLALINLIYSIYFGAIHNLNKLNINFRDINPALNFIKDEIESLMEDPQKGEKLDKIETISFDIKNSHIHPNARFLKILNLN